MPVKRKPNTIVTYVDQHSDGVSEKVTEVPVVKVKIKDHMSSSKLKELLTKLQKK